MHHRIPERSAALAFRAMFMTAPLLALVIPVLSILARSEDVANGFKLFFEERFGLEAGIFIDSLAQAPLFTGEGLVIVVTSFSLVIYGVTMLFHSLSRTLREIFETPQQRGFWSYIESVFITFVFVLMLSIMPFVGLFAREFGGTLLKGFPVLVDILSANIFNSAILGSVLFIGLFAMYSFHDPIGIKTFHRAPILGACVAAVGYIILGVVIGWYASLSATVAFFGPAAFLFLILLWFYYGAQMILVGALVTKFFNKLYSEKDM